jgi:hypothetical protein
MADIKINGVQEINNILVKIKDNVLTARTDVYFFLLSDISIEDLEEKAFKRNILLTINKENSIVYSFSLSKLLL